MLSVCLRSIVLHILSSTTIFRFFFHAKLTSWMCKQNYWWIFCPTRCTFLWLAPCSQLRYRIFNAKWELISFWVFTYNVKLQCLSVLFWGILRGFVEKISAGNCSSCTCGSVGSLAFNRGHTCWSQISFCGGWWSTFLLLAPFVRLLIMCSTLLHDFRVFVQLFG